MTRRHKDLLYVGLALILAGVAVQRFRAFGSRSQRSLWSGERGSLSEFGRQVSRASRILKEKDGKTLLWASGNPRSDDAEWFDVTGTPMDPAEFQYAIGKDTIRAIDLPFALSCGDLVQSMILDGVCQLGV